MGVTGYVNHTPGKAPCPGAVGQHKANSTVFCVCCLFCSGIFFLPYWLLFVCSEPCFLFYDYLGEEKDSKHMKLVGLGSGEDLGIGEGEYDQHVCFHLLCPILACFCFTLFLDAC